MALPWDIDLNIPTEQEIQAALDVAAKQQQTRNKPNPRPGYQQKTFLSVPELGIKNQEVKEGTGVRFLDPNYDPATDPNFIQGQQSGGSKNSGSGSVRSSKQRSGASTGTGRSTSVTQRSTSNPMLASILKHLEAAEARRRETERKRDELYNTLLERSRQSLDIDPNDPIIRKQSDVYSAQQERARRNYLSDLAERSRPTATGAMQGQERITAERLGQNTAAFEAQLFANELTARRNEVSEALQSIAGLLDGNQVATLQKEISLLDNMIDQYRVDAQSALGFAGLDVQRYGIDTQAATARLLANLEAAVAREGLGLQAEELAARIFLGSQGLSFF